MSISGEQLQLFPATSAAIEAKVQAILARRRAYNTSGQAGEDIHHIRAALAAEGATP